jgi:MFS transporter, MHS family, proline/betaine transporter
MANALTKNISAGLVGNIIEVYDMSIYGYLAPFIALNFFPSNTTSVALMKTFGVFFIGFLARPIGSLMFGHIGDRRGRKLALVFSIVLMALATCFIGLLPTYHQAGEYAAILLIVMRLFQGFSVGGEYLGSSIFLVEHAPKNKRGLFGGLAMMSGNLGMLFAVLVCWLLTLLSTHQQITHAYWRLPFLLAIFGGIAGLWVRLKAFETTVFVENRKRFNSLRAHPLRETLSRHKKALVLIICLTWLGVVATYLTLVYMTTYLVTYLHFTMHEALTINIVSVVWLLAWVPFSGYLSDRYGRKNIMLIGATGLILGILPYYLLMGFSNFALAFVAQLLIMIPLGLYCGVTPTCIVELVPTPVRFSASTLGYNVGAAIFGGTTPLLAIWLVHITGSLMAPGLYLVVVGLLTLLVVYNLVETSQIDLNHSLL